MSDYLHRLVARTRSASNVIRPDSGSLFETAPSRVDPPPSPRHARDGLYRSAIDVDAPSAAASTIGPVAETTKPNSMPPASVSKKQNEPVIDPHAAQTPSVQTKPPSYAASPALTVGQIGPSVAAATSAPPVEPLRNVPSGSSVVSRNREVDGHRQRQDGFSQPEPLSPGAWQAAHAPQLSVDPPRPAADRSSIAGPLPAADRLPADPLTVDEPRTGLDRRSDQDEGPSRDDSANIDLRQAIEMLVPKTTASPTEDRHSDSPASGPDRQARIAPAGEPDARPARAGRHDEPTIRVTIGRVEVRAVAPSNQPTPRALRPRLQPALSLSEYLQRRKDGRR